MKYLSFYCLLMCLLQAQVSSAQDDAAFHLLKSVKGDIVAFTVDNLDNLYVLNSRNQLKKYNANGDSVAVFNNVRNFGTATLVDVSNPLKVLVYYKDFATVVVLDRFLNSRNQIDLRKQNILQARAIGQSYDNKIWIYDELENKLKKMDEDGRLLQETPDFRLLTGEALTPVKIYDENMFVYLYDSLKGVYVFDYFGMLKNKILITRWKNFKVSGKYIYGSMGDTLYRYEISSFRYDEWKMPEALTGSRFFNFTNSRVYAMKDNEIRIYTLK